MNSPDVGTSFNIADYTQLCSGDGVSVIESVGGTTTQIQSSTVPRDINCHLSDTEVGTSAEYDGSSWIVSTSLTNTGTQSKTYSISLSDGATYSDPTTITLDPGQSQTVTKSFTTTNSETPPDTIIIGPPTESDEDVQLSSDDSDSQSTPTYTGGPSSGTWIHPPYTGAAAPTSSTNDDSGPEFGTSSESDSPAVSLSASRVSPNQTVQLYANLTTTEEASDATLLVYALSSDGTNTVVSNTSHSLSKGKYTTVEVPFNISESGDYVITTSLADSTTVVKAGSLHVTESSNITVSNTSVSPSDSTIGETITVSASITNPEASEKTITAQFAEGTEIYNSTTITIEGESTEDLTTTYSTTTARTHEFYLGLKELATVTNLGTAYVNNPTGVNLSTSTSPSTTYVDDPIEFTASATTPDDVSITEYYWRFGDGTTQTTTNSTVTHAYSTAGEFDYSVTAIDSTGNETRTGSTVTVVTGAPEQPSWAGDGTADYELTLEGASTTPLGESYTVTANVTNLSTETIAEFEWVIDGTSYTTSTNSFDYTFTEEGPKTIYARAIDESDGYATDSIDVTVEENPDATRVSNSLQETIDNAATGDVIIADGGEYSNINVNNQITLIGESGATINSASVTATGATVSRFTFTDTINVKSRDVSIEHSTINSTTDGIYTDNVGGLTVTNSTMHVDGSGFHFYAGRYDTRKNFLIKNTNITSGESTISGNTYWGDGHVKNIVIDGGTINTSTQVFQAGTGVRAPSGTGDITIEQGSGAVALISRSFNSGNVNFNSTTLTDGKHSISVPDGYFQTQTALNLYGSDYTLSSAIPLSPQVNVRATGTSVDGIMFTKASGDALRIYGDNSRVQDAELSSRLWVGGHGVTADNTTITSSGDGVYTRNVNDFTITDSTVTAGGSGLHFFAHRYDTRENFLIKNSTVTSTESAISGNTYWGDGTVRNIVVEDGTIDTDGKIFQAGEGVQYPSARGSVSILDGDESIRFGTTAYTTEQNVTITADDTLVTDANANVFTFPTGYLDTHSTIIVRGADYTLHSEESIDNSITNEGTNVIINVTR